MWEVVSETSEHAYIRSKVHDFEAEFNYRRHRQLGFVVTILTAIVSTSVFAALTQNNPNFWIQVITGVLSVAAFVLSALQNFYGYSDLAEKHKKAGSDFLFIKKRAEVFLSTYGKWNFSDAQISKANEEQAAILELFTKVSEDSPIRTAAAYDEIIRRLKRRSTTPSIP